MSDFAITVTMPVETEEWAEGLLTLAFDGKHDDVRRTSQELILRTRRGGNVDAVSHARGVLDDIEDCLREGNIDLFSLHLAVVPA